MIESDQVATLIVKDMSRLGRNYIEVGQLTETILPMHDVRLIAINDGVDSDKGEDDFTPFRNIMNEWYAKDMSRKMRSTLKIKNSQGYAPLVSCHSAIRNISITINFGLSLKRALKLLRKSIICTNQ